MLITNIPISDAILITGGQSKTRSAELFLPWSNSTCKLPALPDQRAEHVQSGNMMCGGGFRKTERSCTKWNAEQGAWVTLQLRLTEPRQASTAWTVGQDHGMVILGGGRGDAAETSETVSSDGVSTRPAFNIKYPTRCDYCQGPRVRSLLFNLRATTNPTTFKPLVSLSSCQTTRKIYNFSIEF